MVKIINNSVCRGVAGARASATPSGVVIHNTADNATAKQHMNRLAGMSVAQLAAGFAHYFIDETTVVRTEDTFNCAWHTANANGNTNFVGYEVCRSTGDEATFLQAEQNTFKQIAEDMLFWGMKPSRATVMLHKEFSATACPHRSWELHGKATNAVKDYFISQISKYMTGNNTSNSNDETSNKTQIQEDDETMVLIHAAGAIHKYEAGKLTTLANNKEVDVIRDIYKAKHKGEEIPVLKKDEAWLKLAKAISKR
ncbi:peptidoglycan recognition protein [Enterococcus sp. BWR-S5]|nr:peptidoglycan recognition protein [Enterococcus sp. BWR-S5]